MFSFKKVHLLWIVFFLISRSGGLLAQCNLLCNTDFENVPTVSSVALFDASQVPCWNTIASDNKIEVWHTGFGSVPSYSGTYFIELNANLVSTLYQNFVTTPGTSVTVSFAHRGRAGTDVMSVSIGPVGGPYTTLGTYSDGTTAWGYYTVGYTIPTGLGNNYSLRFNSISAAGGNPAIGNFLDAITVTLPSAATLSFNTNTVSCFGGNDGVTGVTVSNGTGPYTYTWTPTSAHTSSLTGITSGTYSVVVTESNGCQTTGTVQVTQNTALTTTVTSQSIPCSGSNNGSAQVTAAGNVGPYTYSWSPGGVTTSTISGLSTGTYSVQVTSAAGCTKTNTITILQNASFNSTLTSQAASCASGNDGSAQISVSGGTGPYSYTWTPSGINTYSIGGLSQGIYTVQVQSSGGCTGTNTVAVSQNLVLSVPVNTQSVSCFGGTDGSAQTVMNSLAGPYTYTWMPGNVNTPGITGLAAGNYTVYVANMTGCAGTATVTITQPQALNLSFNVQNPSCFGASDGSAQVNASNGVGPFSYTWTPGNIHTQTLPGIAAGNYTVQVLTGNNCPATGSVTVSQGLPLNLSLFSQGTSCLGASDGEAIITGSNGNGPFTYTWSPGSSHSPTITALPPGTYTAQTSDANGCAGTATIDVVAGLPIDLSITPQNTSCLSSLDGSATAVVNTGQSPYSYTWSPGGMNTQTINGLAPGTYSLLVTSANGCSGTSSVMINQGVALNVSATSQNISCPGFADGSISGTVSGAGPYSYTWTPGNINSPTATGLSAGIYTLQVTGSSGCTGSSTVSVEDKEVATISSSSQAAFCYDEYSGKAKVSVSNSGAPYTYTWMPQGGNLNEAPNLAAGTYTVLIADRDQCIYQKEIVIPETTEDVLNIPNVFTPNNDGVNDEFKITNACEDYSVTIYDRWGLKMFYAESIKTNHWKGNNMKGSGVPDGVYFYIINSQGKSFTGTVSLFR